MPGFAWTHFSPCRRCTRGGPYVCTCEPGPPQELAKHTSRHSQLTAQPPSKSLLDLPAELRNEMYALVLYKPVPDRDWWQPNLAFTSRQLRNEILPLFYSLTHFRIDIGPGMTVDPRLKGALADTKQARQWALSLTNDDIKDMRKVSLHTDLRYGGDYLQPLMFELEITRSGKVVCGRVPDPDATDLVDGDDDDDGETEWDHVEIYNAELRRGIDALEMALQGKNWSRKTSLKVLGGFRKLRAKAETEDREYDKRFPV